MEPIRMPMSVAARTGVSGVAALADERRIILTSHGRAVAVVDSAARIDEDVQRLRAAAVAVVDASADLVRGRAVLSDLEAVCGRLGIDAGDVRRRAAAR